MKNAPTALTAFLVIIIPIIALLSLLVISHNGLVSKEEQVLSSWAQVESNFQRRADLIPNLVKTVKAYASHEKNTLTEVIAQRSNTTNEIQTLITELQKSQEEASALNRNIPQKLENETYMKALVAAQMKVGDNMNKLFGLVERYPDLRSSDHFMALQAQLEGTENRINISRMRFNEAVEIYNTAIRKIPGNFMAALGGFNRKAYFKSDEGNNKVKDIKL